MQRLLDIVVPVYGAKNQELILDKLKSYKSEKVFKENSIKFILVHDNKYDMILPELNWFSRDSSFVELYSLSSNKGTHYARCYGVYMTDSKYVTFLDSDDWYDLSELSKVLEILKLDKYDFVDTIGTYNDVDRVWNDDKRYTIGDKLTVNDIAIGGPTSICYGFYESRLIKSALSNLLDLDNYSVYSEDLIEMLAILSDENYKTYYQTSFRPYKYEFTNGGISNEIISISKLTRIIRSTKTNLEMLKKISITDDLKYIVSNTMSHNVNNFTRQYLGLPKVPWGV